MVAQAERMRLLEQRSAKSERSFQDVVSKIPGVLSEIRSAPELSEAAKTPEGKYALTYLLAAQRVISPALTDITLTNTDLLTPTGGPEYNPHRSIDEIGGEIARKLAEQTRDIPKFWIHLEESGKWERAHPNGDMPKDGERFAVIDPLDMTHSLTKGEALQTTGIALFDKSGKPIAVGVASLVDPSFAFVEIPSGITVTAAQLPPAREIPIHTPIAIGALTRRMYDIKSLPLFTDNQGERTVNCSSGYAILQMQKGDLDTIVDPIKGTPWYELAIWGTAAEVLGYRMSDKDGNPIDLSATMRRVIDHLEDDTYRIPFVISRTPDIHDKVLSLLTPAK